MEQTIKLLEHQSTGEGLQSILVYSESNNLYRSLGFSWELEIIANLERANNTASSIFGGYLSQAGEWDLKIIIHRINSYDLNYRVGLTVNRSGTMVQNDNNYISTSKSLDPTSIPSDFTNIAILLSIILATLSGFLFVRGLRHLAITERNLGLR